jgi:hypothetical protein
MAITRITKIDAKVKYNDYRSTNDWSDSQITVDTPEAAEITIHTTGASKVKLTRADLLEALGVRETPTVPLSSARNRVSDDQGFRTYVSVGDSHGPATVPSPQGEG